MSDTVAELKREAEVVREICSQRPHDAERDDLMFVAELLDRVAVKLERAKKIEDAAKALFGEWHPERVRAFAEGRTPSHNADRHQFCFGTHELQALAAALTPDNQEKAR